jgi:hypothetical protein
MPKMDEMRKETGGVVMMIERLIDYMVNLLFG